ncbi:hypothetical protein JCM19237_294 [Photobacterium aphoticum]|uniref:DUF4236 domain-containing protein n=1 Tax=Photobacterium aphoticum TaxID=754436 RepID=A0A090R1D2_9GAMM|nr:hypothetical protein JCM19237_294 [Photobacterium aphoticum]
MTIGGSLLSFNISRRGVFLNSSLKGTGLSYRKQIKGNKKR